MSLLLGGHATLYVTDLDASLTFYVVKLEMTLVSRIGDALVSLAAGTFELSLHTATPAAPRPGTSGAITVGFAVPAPLEETIAKLEARGVWFRGGVIEAAGVRRAFFGDPDGNDLYLFEQRAG